MESYRTTRTCCREIVFTVDENDILTSVRFVNGCSGNTQGISRLAVGQHIDTLIEKKTALLEEMETYKKSVIYEYVTGKKEVER